MAKRKRAVSAKTARREESTHTLLSLPQLSSRKNQDIQSKVIAYIRVSDYYPDWRRYRDEQLAVIEETAAKCGCKVVGTFFEIQKRWRFSPSQRQQLLKAVKLARKTGYPILAKDITRLVGYRDKHRFPSEKRIAKFLSLYPDVTFLTVYATSQIKSIRTKRGQAATGNKGGGDHGPGWMTRRRDKLRLMVQRLHDEDGLGSTRIKELMDIYCKKHNIPLLSRSTIQRWIRQ